MMVSCYWTVDTATVLGVKLVKQLSTTLCLCQSLKFSCPASRHNTREREMTSQAGLKAAKAVLRKKMKERLTGLTAESRAEQSRRVTEKLLASSQYRTARSVALYLRLVPLINIRKFIVIPLPAWMTRSTPRQYWRTF